MKEVIEPTPREKILLAEIEAKDIVVKEKETVIETLKLKTRPRSLGFYRSRFR